MKNKKVIVCISIIVIIGIDISLKIYRFYKPESYISYEELPFEYAGSACGRLDIVAVGEPEEWGKEEYVYNQYNGYFIITEKSWDFCAKACEFSDLDFEPQFEENHTYICTYGYRLKTLEYSNEKRTGWSHGYYNRATLCTDDYHEKTYYFYEIGEIGNELGNMLEDNEAYAHEFTDSNYKRNETLYGK